MIRSWHIGWKGVIFLAMIEIRSALMRLDPCQFSVLLCGGEQRVPSHWSNMASPPPSDQLVALLYSSNGISTLFHVEKGDIKSLFGSGGVKEVVGGQLLLLLQKALFASDWTDDGGGGECSSRKSSGVARRNYHQ